MSVETLTDVDEREARDAGRSARVLSTLDACPGGLCLREIAGRAGLDGGQVASALARLEAADEIEADDEGLLTVWRRR